MRSSPPLAVASWCARASTPIPAESQKVVAVRSAVMVSGDWAITAASRNKDLAAEFLAYMIEAKTQKLVSDVTHYTPANPDAAEYLSVGEKKSLHLDDPDAYMLHIYFWQDVSRRAKYNEIWNEVKAAQ